MSSQRTRRSDTFALIIPISLEAENVLALEKNRRHLCSPGDLAGVVVKRPKGSRRRCAFIAKLNLATFFARNCVCIGSSRATEIKLPAADDISDFHLSIHFDMGTEALMITDTSASGTWIGRAQADDGECFELLHRSTMPLFDCTSLYFGRDRRYHFHLDISRYTQDPSRFKELLARYAQSTPWASFALAGSLKRRKSSHQDSSNKQPFFGETGAKDDQAFSMSVSKESQEQIPLARIA